MEDLDKLKKEIENIVVKAQAEAINIIAVYGFKESKDKEKELKRSKNYYRNQLLSTVRQREKELLKEEKKCLKEISEILAGNNWCRHSVVEDKIDTRLKVIKELSNE